MEHGGYDSHSHNYYNWRVSNEIPDICFFKNRVFRLTKEFPKLQDNNP